MKGAIAKPPSNYRIKKLCATAIAHTAPHARNPSGYPDGSSCVLADQSCARHVSVREQRKREWDAHVAPENRPQTTRKADDTLCSAIGKSNRCWRSHCLKKKKGALASEN